MLHARRRMADGPAVTAPLPFAIGSRPACSPSSSSSTAVCVTWLLRQGYAVHRLTRGVGDTWFLAADGRRWFRMDEHRRDVPLAEIPEHLQHAFIAIEDHRFYAHPGVDPIALGRAVVRNLRSPGTRSRAAAR